MGLMAGQDGAIDGYEPVPPPSGQPAGPPRAATMFRRRSAQPSRRAVLHLRTSRDAPVPLELAAWFTERSFHFYVGSLPGPVVPGPSTDTDFRSVSMAQDASRPCLMSRRERRYKIAVGAIAAAVFRRTPQSAACDPHHRSGGRPHSTPSGIPAMVPTQIFRGYQRVEPRPEPAWEPVLACVDSPLPLSGWGPRMRAARGRDFGLGA